MASNRSCLLAVTKAFSQHLATGAGNASVMAPVALSEDGCEDLFKALYQDHELSQVATLQP